MATSNNDRISSRRLLDTLKGLQESRHLGSEPEVVTETVEYPAEVFPKSGTYTGNDVIAQLGTASFDLEHNLPIKVYGSITSGTGGFVVPDKSGEPLATLNVVSKPSGLTVISDIEVTDEMISNQPITGHYFLMQQGDYWFCFYEIADVTNFNTAHVWETTAYTETTTTKTKHTIKQDYVPNADWTVNDPDADGYVQGRTHWVEEGASEWVLNNVDIGSGLTTVDSFAKPLYWVNVNNEFRYEPDYSAVFSSVDGMDTWLLAEDGNGNQITDIETAMSTDATGVACIDGTTLPEIGSVVIMAVYRGVINPSVGDTIGYLGEVVHKLDRKFYDYTAPYIVPDYRDDNTLTNDLGLGFGVNEHVNCYGHINLHTHPDGTTKYFGFDDIVLENSHSYQTNESIYLGTKFIESLKNEYNDFKTVIGDTDFGYQLRRLLHNLYTRIVFSDQNLLFNNYPEELQKLMVRTNVYNHVYMPYKTSETEYEPLVALDYIYSPVGGVETKGIVPKLIIKENGSSRSVMYPSDTLYFFTIFNKRNKMIL